jgi:hypothetical protein
MKNNAPPDDTDSIVQAMTILPDAFEVLVRAMEALPAYRNWCFTCEYPGLFCFRHPDNDFAVFCTPDWGEDETLPIHVQLDDGTLFGGDDINQQLPLPREGRSAEKILELVRPTLNKLLALPTAAQQPRAATLASPPKAPLPSDVLHLNARQIEALRKAYEHVRQSMAQQHGWTVRDDALDAIDLALRAARVVSS